jgi:inner membrane protein
MDPLTHALAGAALGYALFGRPLGRHSAALGALAAVAPDIDHFVSSVEDPLLYVEVHRSFTHSFLFSIIGSLISTLPWILRKGLRPRWKLLWACAWPAYLSHCLIDASTSYGTQLLWPFSRARFGWDLIAVIDPLFSGVLALALIIAIARRKPGWAAAGVYICFAYLVLGGIQHYRAANVQRQLAAVRGHVIERSEIMPTLGNNVVWRSLYLYRGQIYSDRLRVGWFSGPSYHEGTALPLQTVADLKEIEVDGNRRTRAFERFAWFSDGWVARSPFDPDVLGDMRYSISTRAFDPIWGIRFTGKQPVCFEWVNRQLERSLSLNELWSEIVGTHPDYHVVN